MKPKHLLLLCCILALLKVNAQRPFITIWNTANPGASANNQIIFRGTGTNYNISWVNLSNASDTGNAIASGTDTITFAAQGDYKVYVIPGSGTFTAIKGYSDYISNINAYGDGQKLISVEQWGDIHWTSFDSAFSNCFGMVLNATDTPDLSNVTDMSYMFLSCHSLTTNPAMSTWDVSHITNMTGMFFYAWTFNQPIGNWNVSNVTKMRTMFCEAHAFNQPIGNWNVSNVNDMSLMFSDAYAFNQPIGNWNVSNVTDMARMLAGTVFNQPIGNWSVSNVIDMASMFSNAFSFNQPIGNWDVSKVINMSAMFSFDSAFNQPIGNWNVSKVTAMDGMFQGGAFNQPINNWNISNVTRMSFMFGGAFGFNQPIDNWNVSKVYDMTKMFYSASKFNRSLGQWHLNSLRYMYNMLDNSGMNCNNYSETLKGWADSTSTPYGLTLGAANLSYDSAYAQAAHYKLTNTKGWTITGDVMRHCPGILPVNFLSFSVIKQANGALLNWSVADEINNKGYYVERSTNGLTFDSIAFVAGKGAFKQTTYIYTDNTLANGKIYYRIKEVDNDGKYMYSSVQEIEFSNFTWKIHGNPVNKSFIELMLDTPANILIIISSSNGSIIKTIKKGNLIIGNYNIPLDIDNISAGLYIVKLMVNNKAYTAAIIK